MNKGFNKLSNVGAQKIHETTHISKAHIQAILDEKFDNLNSVQLSGFISILEREYDIDLGELKNNAILYFNEHAPEILEETKVKVFVSHKRKKVFALFYIGIAIALVIALLSLDMISVDNNISKVVKIDNSVEHNSKDTLKDTLKDKEIIQKQNIIAQDKPNEKEIKKQLDKSETLSLKITPVHEVWMGYIDLSTHEKYQKIFIEEFTLDPKRNWLLAFGHGYINIEINGIIKKFKNPKNIRFSYINSQLKEINLEELKVLNKGNRW